MKRQFARIGNVVTALARDTQGLALIELAYGLPILLGVGFGGMEIANLAVTRMRVSQIAMGIADNATRAGDAQGMALKKVFESDIYDTFEGARIQGSSIQFKERARVVLSSLQQNSAGGQWIAWQRCYGNKPGGSSFGVAGAGKSGTALTGMGPAGSEIQAPPSGAVMYVEVTYSYKALVEPFAKGLQYFGLNVDSQDIKYRAAYIVRDARQLGVSTIPNTTTAEDFGLFQNTPAVPRLTC